MIHKLTFGLFTKQDSVSLMYAEKNGQKYLVN